MKISIYGAGAYGVTLAQILNDNQHEVLLYTNLNETLTLINEEHRHPIFKTKLARTIKATTNIEEALAFSDIILICLPSSVIRPFFTENKKYIKKPYFFINSSKGIEHGSMKTISEILNDILPPEYIKSYTVLSGPGHAEELILRNFTALVAASKDEESALLVQQLFSNDYVRIYTSFDVIGVEVGGAVKNVISIITGAATGIGLGENTRAAIITRGMLEIALIVKAMGGDEKTAYGLSGLGDLVVTALSKNSRNFQFGYKLGQGLTIEEAEKEMKQVVEGTKTVNACYNIAKKYELNLPIIETAYQFLNGNFDLKTALDNLIKRELKMEYKEVAYE